MCDVLSIKNQRDALNRINEEDVGQADVLSSQGSRQRTNVVNESGLYELIFRSDKPQAKAFRRWVTGEVLPQIRRTGSYSVKPLTPAELILQQAQQLVDHDRRVSVLEQRMDSIEQKTDQYTAIGYAKRERLETTHEYLNRLGRAAARITRAAGEEPSKVYSELWGEVNSYPGWALSEAAGGLGR